MWHLKVILVLASCLMLAACGMSTNRTSPSSPAAQTKSEENKGALTGGQQNQEAAEPGTVNQNISRNASRIVEADRREILTQLLTLVQQDVREVVEALAQDESLARGGWKILELDWLALAAVQGNLDLRITTDGLPSQTKLNLDDIRDAIEEIEKMINTLSARPDSLITWTNLREQLLKVAQLLYVFPPPNNNALRATLHSSSNQESSPEVDDAQSSTNSAPATGQIPAAPASISLDRPGSMNPVGLSS